ncbi:sigma-54-dependent Fis family transcriptional regulator [Herbaspirillum sp. alder98]|uniref:sigma-54-dependent Fis family transcriptional regulator n=1 Tax=Herbaspirillum sp. alder98 TaxID=2913096 RepID=UPI001CD8B7FD|nr:sigma-54-dependent Fis family transcriptional regulator [Herbaspirillum sp. alder98]MCA1322748.1 sigma-54-dependent Fis family transcriptional regulator [Herbaspirillum sp. alder98]
MQTQAGRPGAGGAPQLRPASDTRPLEVQIIERAHQRSCAHGITRAQHPDLDLLSRADLALTLEANRALSGHAQPVMETLYDQIRNTHSMVILSDANGTILHSLGDSDFLAKADRVALGAGGCWSEQSRGTNAIGTALFEQQPTTVHAQQHYLDANRFLTCSAAPIFDHRGQVTGVLDVSGECGSFHQHTLALVRMSAQMIENQLLAGSFADCITLHFHSRAEFVGTLVEGMVSFSPGGRFLAANRSAQFQLGLSPAALASHTFSSLFGAPLSMLFEYYRRATPARLTLRLHNGISVHARAEMQLQTSDFQRTRDAAARPTTTATRPTRTGLQALDTGDARMHAVLTRVQRVIGRDIPILITGETGTGKEWLARAIHEQVQSRSTGGAPFVAVNCAAIPEHLIEAELFGYEDGAFTGARRKGAVGKIAQANGGTLFLDEIGDMPLALQGRLLRVLQERAVTPLGSERLVQVAFTLVCATNQPLADMARQHAFREDLYYRINGLQVSLPALRERDDLRQLIDIILAAEHAAVDDGSVMPQLSEEVLQRLLSHAWPGNLRQMTNVMRTALAMAAGESRIGLQHLPPEWMASEAPRASPPSGRQSAPLSLQDNEWETIERALQAHPGNVSAAARALGISRNTLYRRLKAHATSAPADQ